MSTRCDPAGDIDIMRTSRGSKVDPPVADGDVPYNARALLDACRPFERLATFPPVAQARPRLVRDTVRRWRALFADPWFPLPASAIPSASVGE